MAAGVSRGVGAVPAVVSRAGGMAAAGFSGGVGLVEEEASGVVGRVVEDVTGDVDGAGEVVSGVDGTVVSFGRIGDSPVVGVGGADEWCVAGMTAPVRVNVGGRMDVGRGSCVAYWAVYRGAFRPIRVGNPALC